jgi:hypothetical protein
MDSGLDVILLDVTYSGRVSRLSLPRSVSTFADILPSFKQANPLLLSVDLEVRKYVCKGRSYDGSDQSVLLSSLESKPGEAISVMMQASTGAERKLISEAKPARLRDDLGPQQHRFSSYASSSSLPKHSGPLYGGSREAGDMHGFGSVSVLPGFADGDVAQSILEGIARDPGVLAVMKERKWFVPVLGELYPDGKVGTDPVCVLGLNENSGQRILLRIRTDDLLGFRKIGIVMQTVWHELAHNMLSEHTGEFYALVSALKRRGDELDWTKSKGHVLSNNESIFRRENLFGRGEGRSADPLTFGSAFDESMNEASQGTGGTSAASGGVVLGRGGESGPHQSRLLAGRGGNQKPQQQEERSSGKKRYDFADDDNDDGIDESDSSSMNTGLQNVEQRDVESFLMQQRAGLDSFSALSSLQQTAGNEFDMSVLDGDTKSVAEVEERLRSSLESALAGLQSACAEADISFVDALETLRGIFERAKTDRSGQFTQLRKKNAAFVNRTTGTAPAVDVIICGGWKHDGEWLRFNNDYAALWLALDVVEAKIERSKRKD